MDRIGSLCIFIVPDLCMLLTSMVPNPLAMHARHGPTSQVCVCVVAGDPGCSFLGIAAGLHFSAFIKLHVVETGAVLCVININYYKTCCFMH